ncbi:YraN family protein [Candidatus Daviesbacteria bacterium]|nr:YraN family protein [Candidatus Daviesbacteria bacterium]
MFKQRLGAKGEELACNYLKNHGIKIIQRNYYTRFGEIDIIGQEAGQLVFVEVKTRTSREFGLPEEAITQTKIARMQKAAFLYISYKKLTDQQYRFDAVVIEFAGEKLTRLEHLKNIG